MRTIRMLRIAGVVALAATVSASVATTAQGHAQSTSGRHTGPIKIGMISQLTGPNAAIGQLQIDGAKLAVQELNAHGGVLGRKIVLDIADDRSTDTGGLAAALSLTGDPNVSAIISPVYSTEVKTIDPVIQRTGVPFLTPGTDPSLTALGDKWLFRTRPSDVYGANAIAAFAVKGLKLRNWAVVYDTNTFGQSANSLVTSALLQLGATVSMDTGVDPNSQDYTAVIEALKNSGAQGLITYIGNPTEVGIFASQLHNLGVNMKWIGSSSTLSTASVKLAGSTLEGVYAAEDYLSNQNAQTKSYCGALQKADGVACDIISAPAFDSVNLIALAIKNARSTSRAAIRAALAKIHGYRGVTGVYSFDKSGNGIHADTIVQMYHGSLRFIHRMG